MSNNLFLVSVESIVDSGGPRINWPDVHISPLTPTTTVKRDRCLQFTGLRGLYCKNRLNGTENPLKDDTGRDDNEAAAGLSIAGIQVNGYECDTGNRLVDS